jgi:hypothetical protein
MTGRRFELKISGPISSEEARQCPDAPPYLAQSDDGSASVYVDGELVAVSDEYATAYLASGSGPWPMKEEVEKFLSAGLEFYGEATRHGEAAGG